MAVASFEELCAGFCEIIRVTPPALKADHEGLVAFHVLLRGVTINVVQRPAESSDHVFVVFELGPTGHGGATSASELQALLEANYALLRVHPPVFSRNPGTGDAVMQYIFPLSEATPNDLYDLIERGVDWVSNWRDRLADEPGNAPEASSPASALAMAHQLA